MERDLEPELLKELVGWAPVGGVVSVYFEIDPGDRGEGWLIALKDGLRELPGSAARRVLDRFPGDTTPSGRAQIGFVEAEGEREIWSHAQMEIGELIAAHAPGPTLKPLVRLLDDGWPLGIVVVSLERVRVLEWAFGQVSELDEFELLIDSLDWRERKARQSDPSRGTATSAAGRDQYRQRLEHNRERFLKQAGGLVEQRFGERPWRRIVVIGEADRPRLLAAGMGAHAELVHQVHHDLIAAPTTQIGARLEAELEHLNREREEALVARIEAAINATPGVALGPDEVLRALAEGRVNHVIFDAERELAPVDGSPFAERVIALAVRTGADVTPAEGRAAAALTERDGAAALLRY